MRRCGVIEHHEYGSCLVKPGLHFPLGRRQRSQHSLLHGLGLGQNQSVHRSHITASAGNCHIGLLLCCCRVPTFPLLQVAALLQWRHWQRPKSASARHPAATFNKTAWTSFTTHRILVVVLVDFSLHMPLRPPGNDLDDKVLRFGVFHTG
jgi:hypothetical protein